VSTAPVALPAPAVHGGRSRRLPRPLLWAAGGLVLALILAFVATNVYASLGQRVLKNRFADAAAGWQSLDPVQRSSAVYAAGDPLARLLIPEIGLDVIVAEGANPAVMRRAPGHLPASAIPGSNGVAIVTANRFGFGSYFMRLGAIAEGDQIVTESILGRTTYTVIEVRTVSAGNLDLGTDSSERVLVLFGSSRLWGGPDRIVIRAVAEEQPA